MFYIYCDTYDIICVDNTLFGDTEHIKMQILEKNKYKFGYDDTTYTIKEIIGTIESIYDGCDRNESIFNLVLRAKYPFYEENIGSFFDIYTIIIEFAVLYKKIYSYDTTKSKLFLKKILDISVYNNVKNLSYDIAIINSINSFINNTFKDDFTRLTSNLDFFINNFDIIISFALYDKDLITYINSILIPNQQLLTTLQSIYNSVFNISTIIFLYKILEYDNEEMIFKIFEILYHKNKLLLLNNSLIKYVFNIITPVEYKHLYEKLIYYYDKYYYDTMYKDYHYQNKYIKYKKNIYS